MHPWQYREVEAALGRIQPLPDHVVFAESLEYLAEEAMAICLSLEGCRGAWARAREELLRVGAQDGGTVDHADKTSLNRSKVPGAEV